MILPVAKFHAIAMHNSLQSNSLNLVIVRFSIHTPRFIFSRETPFSSVCCCI
jgi:hypothetical protein